MTSNQPALEQALATASGLRAGTWESVEALSMLAIESLGRPESLALLKKARRTAEGLRPGSWDSVRALTWLARAEHTLDPR